MKSGDPLQCAASSRSRDSAKEAESTMSKSTPTSVLFLVPCSLTKRQGGEPHYDESDTILSGVQPGLGGRLLERREEMRGLVKGNRDVTWQGVPLADLEYNRDLNGGPDFGGRRTAWYLPAIDRYQGRFYGPLGEGRRQVTSGRGHHLLMLSGLYGLVCPSERIQLYSCPLTAEVAEAWNRDSLLTDVLSAYVERYEILRIFDLLAIDAYRRLIDWQRIRDSGVEILHCFYTMASGENALTSFGRALASDLIGRSEDDLIGIGDGDRIEDIMFRSSMATPTGYPDEVAAILAARNESRIWEPQSPGDDLPVAVRGGIPDSSPNEKRGKRAGWKFTHAQRFWRGARKHLHLLNRVVEAMLEICESPISVRGNTVKPLQGELVGMWRYRIGDFRLIYEPDPEARTVHFVDLKPRAEAYE